MGLCGSSCGMDIDHLSIHISLIHVPDIHGKFLWFPTGMNCELVFLLHNFRCIMGVLEQLLLVLEPRYPLVLHLLNSWFSWLFIGLLRLLPFLCNVVSNNHCPFLWGPAILGRAGACQGSRSSSHPSWWVWAWEVGWCNILHARYRGIFNLSNV